MHVMKTLVGVLDWGLPVDQAIALPNIFLSGNAILVEKGTSLAAMRDRLTALGHIVTPAELGSKVNADERRDGAWKGGADPRSEGVHPAACRLGRASAWSGAPGIFRTRGRC